MSKGAKAWLIIAASLILLGGIIFGAVMAKLNWDFTKLSTVKYETNRYEINEDYESISIITDTADIVFVPSEDSKAYVECYEQENAKHSVTLKDGTLVIELVDTRKWYDHIGFNFDSPKITVHLPKGECSALSVSASTSDVQIPRDFSFESIDISVSTGDVKCYASASDLIKIKASTGDIDINGIVAKSLNLSVSTGKITVSGVSCDDAGISVSTGKAYLTDIECKNVSSSGSTGDISLKNVLVLEKLSIVRSTGDVTLEGCDAAEILIKTDTGDVTGSLLSEKIFFVQSDTGKKDVPKTTTGGICEITTDTGDIKITIK